MIFIGIGIIVAIVIAVRIYLSVPESYSFREKATEVIIFSSLSALMVSLVTFAVVMGVSEIHDGEDRHDFSFEIIAAGDSSTTQGSFFLFGGTIDEYPVYMYYRQFSGGAIRQGSVYTYETTIYEDTENEGRVDVIETGCTDWDWFTVARCDDKRYEVHVPEDSVAKQFKFDLD